MANTTFQGPVRSWNGFQTVGRNGTTGALETTDTMGGGAGVSDALILEQSVTEMGGLIKTEIFIDLTGLDVNAASDIIGDTGESAAYIAQIDAALHGTIVAGRMICFEVPTGGDPDIDVYAADEATGAENDAISGLTETALVDAGDATLGSEVIFTGFPTDGQYIYLVAGAGATVFAAYTGGKLLIELYGHNA